MDGWMGVKAILMIAYSNLAQVVKASVQNFGSSLSHFINTVESPRSERFRFSDKSSL